MPLGFSAKMWMKQGDRDRNGLPVIQDGWYYKWYRGLQILCGEERIDKYEHRPSHEDPMEDIWYFDIHFRWVYQEGEHGQEETEEVDDRIGSHVVPALIPIAKNTNSSSGRPRKKSKLVLHPPRLPKKSKSRVNSSDNEEIGHDEDGTGSAAGPSSSQPVVKQARKKPGD